ncbi:MAG: aspartate-semialdehyde dehydrogenase [Bacteroidetes bacterium]|nr:aspartate-semialdehyde dehydrogenase [Bacteroidota bacterium]
MKGYHVAVVGATGLVGRTMLAVLEERNFPVATLRPIASGRSAGTSVPFRGALHPVIEISDEAFAGVDIALFSAGGDTAKRWAPSATARGAVVIDNSSAFRMDGDVPLIVPEVNAAALIDTAPRIIANPNCSTIQMVVALEPLRARYGIHRIVVCTYQAVSGAGKKGVDQLQTELEGRNASVRAFAHPIAGNALPHIASFERDGFTTEERKMIDETRKIFGDQGIMVSPTCVRIPVVTSHSEAVHVELENPFALEDIRSILENAPGVIVIDDPEATAYPLASTATGRDEVFVGRLRRDPSIDNGLIMWVVSDNLRKGAATNAVQIAELWHALRQKEEVATEV